MVRERPLIAAKGQNIDYAVSVSFTNLLLPASDLVVMFGGVVRFEYI